MAWHYSNPIGNNLVSSTEDEENAPLIKGGRRKQPISSAESVVSDESRRSSLSSLSHSVATSAATSVQDILKKLNLGGKKGTDAPAATPSTRTAIDSLSRPKSPGNANVDAMRKKLSGGSSSSSVAKSAAGSVDHVAEMRKKLAAKK
jgi:hypothetical protein